MNKDEKCVLNVFSTEQAANVLGVSRKSILLAIAEGKMRAVKLGKGYLIKESWIDEYLESEARK